MKGKNIVFIAKSLDGYISDRNGGLDWLISIDNPEQTDMGYGVLIEEVDAIVMGRNTFEVVCGFKGAWPYKKHVFVLSNSLTTAPDKCNNNVSFINGCPREILAVIHGSGYHTLYIDGGRTIQDFLKEDLIDEIKITTFPIILGGGFSLFDKTPVALSYEHEETKVFLGQYVQSSYKRKR